MADPKFWDRIAAAYAARPVGDPAAYEATLERVRAYLAPDMRLIEVGCGTGSTAVRLGDAVAAYHGTDVSPAMIALAREKDAPESVSFSVAEAGDALAPGADGVLAFSVLHLFDDLPDLLSRINRALPESGLFISKTPCLGGKPWFRPLVAVMQIIGKAPRPVHHLRPRALHRMIEEAGFEIVETADLPPRIPHHFIVARKRSRHS